METEKNRKLLAEKRAEYMSGAVSHRDYYLWLSGWLGLPQSLIPVTKERVDASTDPHLNDTPLVLWDRMDPAVRSYADAKFIPWSLSDTVCCLKNMALARSGK